MEDWFFFIGQLLFFWAVAPLLEGVIKKVKARLQNRIGADLWQPYRDVYKFLHKDAVLSQESSWLTRFTPYASFAILSTAGLLVPVILAKAPLGMTGDVVVLAYLFALARFFLALTALDAGSSFGAMGSSREMVMAAIVEPALLLAAVAVLLSAGTTSIEDAVAFLSVREWNFFSYGHWLACAAFLIVVIAETGRIPYDNPDTHLELTMLHEALMLEYSGRYLGILHWAVMVKQLILITVFVNFFLPWGAVIDGSIQYIAAGIVLYFIKVFAVGILIAFIETLYAKIRLFMIPKLLMSSMGLSVLAIVLQVVK